MRPRPLLVGLAGAYGLALLGDQMLYAPAMRGMVMGALATAGDLGGAVGPLVGYALAATAGLRWAYGLSAGCLLSVLGALALGRRRGAHRS